MELDSREIATINLFAAFITLAVVLSRNRAEIRLALIGVLKALSDWSALHFDPSFRAAMVVPCSTAPWESYQ